MEIGSVCCAGSQEKKRGRKKKGGGGGGPLQTRKSNFCAAEPRRCGLKEPLGKLFCAEDKFQRLKSRPCRRNAKEGLAEQIPSQRAVISAARARKMRCQKEMQGGESFPVLCASKGEGGEGGEKKNPDPEKAQARDLQLIGSSIHLREWLWQRQSHLRGARAHTRAHSHAPGRILMTVSSSGF